MSQDNIVDEGPICMSKLSRRKDKRYSAGVLPYTYFNNTIYFLLGRDRKEETWSDFGGKSEQCDNGKAENTASREFYEETSGSVIDVRTMRDRLQRKKDCRVIYSKTLNGYQYIMYVVRIPYKDYRNIFLRVFSFIKYVKAHRKFIEKDDIRWVSMSTLMHGIQEKPLRGSFNINLRPIFQRTLQNNVRVLTSLS